MEIEGVRIRLLAGNPALAADLSTLFREIEQTSGNATGAISKLLNKFRLETVISVPNLRSLLAQPGEAFDFEGAE
jgi:hypothetical protein